MSRWATEKLVAGYSRYHKYALCSELRSRSRRVVEQIVLENAAAERLPGLIELRARLE